MISHLAIAVISAATLAYEVLLVRLFAIVQWHHFAFMAISIALLGFGASGTWLALRQEWAGSRFTPIFAVSAALFALSAPASFLAAQSLPFNALAIVWEPGQLLYLLAMYLLLVVPFFCGATCVGIAFVCYGDEVGRIYAFNLAGSAVGALGIVAALFKLSPSDALRLIAALGFVATALVALDRKLVLWPALSAGGAILALSVWAILPEQWFVLQISDYKALPGTLKVLGTKVLSERSGPLSLLTVVESPSVPFRHVPGLSLNAPMTPSDQLGVFSDGDSMTTITRFDGRRERLTYLDYTTDALAYHLREKPRVLVLGAGGGSSVLQALYHQATSIDVVEIDPNMVRLVGKDHAAYAGDIYNRPDVQAHVTEARRFVSASKDAWDVVQIPLLDAFGGAAGMHGLSESYVYTVEALEQYLQHLRPGGWLNITRWLMLPPRDALKLIATALEALRRMGVENPEQRLILVRGLNTVTLLVKNGVVTDTDVARAKAFANERSFDLCYYPGISAGEANRFNILDEPYFFAGAMALIGTGRDAFMDRYKFDIRPSTDERPYFLDFFKWRTLPELMVLRRAGGAGLMELGTLILVATLVQATVLSAVLIMAPLWIGRRVLARSSPTWRVAAYFFALGLGFLFVEIAFIQKFILFLGNPLYALAVVLAGFLLFAGVGSAASSWFAERIDDRHKAIRLSIIGIIAVSLLYLLILPTLLVSLLSLGDMARILAALGLIAPLAFFMGMPFPLGLSSVWTQTRALVPWAWGVNGCASVISAVLAAMIAMSWGYSSVVLVACLLYAVAMVSTPSAAGATVDPGDRADRHPAC